MLAFLLIIRKDTEKINIRMPERGLFEKYFLHDKPE